MSRPDLPRLHALFALLAVAATEEDKPDGVLSKVVSRATGAVADIVDPDAIVERIDVDALLDRIDIDRLLARTDINALLERVDVDRLLARVDINTALDEVDVDRLMSRIDIDAIVARVDVKDVAERAGIPDLVRESTGELAGSAVDVFRRQVVALDAVVGNGAYRLIGRDPRTRPVAPPGLEAAETQGRKGRGYVTGHYAGPLSRLGAFLLDAVIMWVSFLLTVAGITFVADFFIKGDIALTATLGLIGLVALAAWVFLYLSVTLAIAGRTPGMGLVGIRVVDRRGAPLSGRSALARTLVLSVSFLVLGLGFLGVFTSPERRTLHDAAAGSVVVYDWGDRPAEMPAPLTRWIARHADEQEAGEV